MVDYEKLCCDSNVNLLIDSINIVQNNDLIGCHGRYHTMFVVNTVAYILQSLFYDIRTIKLGKIAALLHDIGIIAGRKNHAQKSAALAISKSMAKKSRSVIRIGMLCTNDLYSRKNCFRRQVSV